MAETVTTGSDQVPAVFMPEAVRRAAARAEELMAAQNGGREEHPAPQEAPPAPPPPEEQEETPPPPPPQPEQPARQDAAAEWEQRYRTLQGKYDTEISGLRGQVAGLERLLATMQAPPAQQAPEPAQRAPVEFSQEDKDLYGEDLLDAMARTAEARYAPIIQRLEQQIQQLQGGQQNLGAQRLQDQVFDALDQDPELNGRWRPINTSQDFMRWLQQLDDFSGVSRFDMLQHAYQSGDAMRTARFFKKYMAEHTSSLPAAPPPAAPAPAPRGNGHAAPPNGPRLENFAAPGRANGTGQGGNGAPQTRIWSRPQITAFYRDRTSGKFRGREEESERLEQDIIAAAREGRIH